MFAFKKIQLAGITSLLVSLLTSCYQPPYNNFQPYNNLPLSKQKQGYKAYVGSEQQLITDLNANDIEFIQYGDTRTLIVPTDRYFIFNTPKLNDICYVGLERIIQMLKQYPHSTIYVAGFTDNVGTKFAKNELTQARAEAMLTFLWANGIPAKRLEAEGYGSKYPVANNRLIHGSAQNRRLEIQWFNDPKATYACCIKG